MPIPKISPSLIPKALYNLQIKARNFSSKTNFDNKEAETLRNGIIKKCLQKLTPQEYGQRAVRTDKIARKLAHSSYAQQINHELIEQGNPIFMTKYRFSPYSSTEKTKYEDNPDYLTTKSSYEGLGVIKKTGDNNEDVSNFEKLFHEVPEKEDEVNVNVQQLIFMGKTEFPEKQAVRYALRNEFHDKESETILLSKKVLHKLIRSMDEEELQQRSKERIIKMVDKEPSDNKDRVTFFTDDHTRNSPLLKALLETISSISSVRNPDSGLIDDRLKIFTKQGHSNGLNFKIDTSPLKKLVEWRYRVTEQKDDKKETRSL